MSDKKLTPVGGIISELHERCTETLKRSCHESYAAMNGVSYLFAKDLDAWSTALQQLPEHGLYATAANEYILGFLNSAQGQYRNAFKSLRLALELLLQGVYLSTHLVILNEWLTNQSDTSWSAILNPDEGVFAKRFVRAFCPAAEDDAGTFKSLAETLYREMSECTHGNVPSKIPLPETVVFDETTFELWHAKAQSLHYVATFVLAVRYFTQLPSSSKGTLRPIILDRLGHLESMRKLVGE